MVVSVFALMSLISLQIEVESVREAGGWSLPVQVAYCLDFKVTTAVVLLLHGGQAVIGLTVQDLLFFPCEFRHVPVHLQHPLAVEVVAIRTIGDPQLVD